MSVRAPVEYSSAAALRGPLLVVDGIAGVGWDEVVEIRLDSGGVRHGVVLEVERDLAVIEVFEGTAGMGLDRMRVSFAGTPLQIGVGEGWLGRVCGWCAVRADWGRLPSGSIGARPSGAERVRICFETSGDKT